MASIRPLCRIAPRTTSIIRPSASTPRVALRNTIRQQSRRSYASEASSSSGSTFLIGTTLGAVLAGGGAYYALSQQNSSVPQPKEIVEKVKESINRASHSPKTEDFQQVYNAIAKRLDEKDDYDDGSYGPVLVRLAWHCSGTYDAETKTGGSNGATMRFDPESDHGANAGLNQARLFLEPVKGQYTLDDLVSSIRGFS